MDETEMLLSLVQDLDQAKSLNLFTSENDEFSKAVVDCLRSLSIPQTEHSGIESILPAENSSTFRRCSDLSILFTRLGYKDPVGFQTFMYPSLKDKANIVRFLITQQHAKKKSPDRNSLKIHGTFSWTCCHITASGLETYLISCTTTRNVSLKSRKKNSNQYFTTQLQKVPSSVNFRKPMRNDWYFSKHQQFYRPPSITNLCSRQPKALFQTATAALSLLNVRNDDENIQQPDTLNELENIVKAANLKISHITSQLLILEQEYTLQQSFLNELKTQYSSSELKTKERSQAFLRSSFCADSLTNTVQQISAKILDWATHWATVKNSVHQQVVLLQHGLLQNLAIREETNNKNKLLFADILNEKISLSQKKKDKLDFQIMLSNAPKKERRPFVLKILNISRHLDKQKEEIWKILNDIRISAHSLEDAENSVKQTGSFLKQLFVPQVSEGSTQESDIYHCFIALLQCFEDLIMFCKKDGSISLASSKVSRHIHSLKAQQFEERAATVVQDLVLARRQFQSVVVQENDVQ